ADLEELRQLLRARDSGFEGGSGSVGDARQGGDENREPQAARELRLLPCPLSAAVRAAEGARLGSAVRLRLGPAQEALIVQEITSLIVRFNRLGAICQAKK